MAKLYYCLHKSLPPVPILSQINPVHAPPISVKKKAVHFSSPSLSPPEVCVTDRLPFGLSNCFYMNLQSSSVDESQACLMYGAKLIFMCSDTS